MALRGQRPGADATAANAKSFSSRVTDFRVKDALEIRNELR